MKKILLMLPLLTSMAANADVMVGGWSHHLNDGDFNERNDLFAVEYKNVVAGTFVNSFYNRSYLVGYNLQYETEYVTFGVIPSVVKGYVKGNSDFLDNFIVHDDLAIIAVPYVQLNTPYIQPRIGMMGRAVLLTFNIDL